MISPRFTESIRTWTATQRMRALLLCMAVTLPLSIVVGGHQVSFFGLSDADRYQAMAAGQQTMMPFASRQLSPLLVRALAHAAHLPIQTTFILWGVIWITIFYAATLYLVVRSGAPRWILPAIAGMFFWASQFNNLVFPDLLNAALLAVFLVFLYRQAFVAAALLLLPLFVSRESALLVLACLLIAGWRRLRWYEVLVALLATSAGFLVVQHLTIGALPNHEHLSPALYMLAKLPWNMMRNVFGVILSANLYSAGCLDPTHRLAIHIGRLEWIGFCRLDLGIPAWAFGNGLANFGLLPLLAFQLWRERTQGEASSDAPDRSQILVRFCVLYGGISMLLAPLLGEWFQRLFGYSWPALLVAVPFLLGASSRRENSIGRRFHDPFAAFAFVSIHLLLSWSALARERSPLLPIALAAYALGWLILKRFWTLPKHPIPPPQMV